MRQSLSGYLLAKGASLLTSKLSHESFSKSSMLVLSAHKGLFWVELIKLGNVYEASTGTKHFQSTDEDEIIQLILNQCFEELRLLEHTDLSERYDIALVATTNDGSPPQVTVMRMGQDGNLQYSGIYGTERQLIRQAVAIVERQIEQQSIEFGDILVKDDAGKSICVRICAESAYSTDYDLFAGGGSTFYTKGTGKDLSNSVDTFLAYYFASAKRLQLRVTADDITDRRKRALDLQADSDHGVEFKAPLVFDPPV